MRRRVLLAGLPALFSLPLVPAGAAGDWAPDRSVRLVVPFAPGGSTDLTARLLADRLSPRLGQPVVIENRAGAGGNIGAEAVARAAPDGLTLLFSTSSTQAANPALYRQLPFDPQRDFAPISLVAFIPNLLVVPASLQAENLDALLALARTRTGGLNYGTAGSGTSQHLAAALFAARAGVAMTHVPYRGGAQVLADLLTGKVDLSFAPLIEVIEHVRAGRLRALAITTARRSPLLPDVSTVAETLPNYEVPLWNGVLAPAGTPPAAVDRLSREVVAMLRTPDMAGKLAEAGSEPAGSTPEAFTAFIAAELPRWAELVRISGASVN